MASHPVDNTGSNPEILPRSFLPTFDGPVPRHWCHDDAGLTHFLNTYTLLVPGNEGYFIRTLKRCLPRIADPDKRAMVTQFMRQEGQHGIGHRRFWPVLESQGYRISGFQSRVDGFLYKFLEPLTPFKLRLSMVSCIEHVNAYLGHEFLAQRILEDAEPELRALFEWHFAEEIEHKHVAYDVLALVAPGYALRLLGAALVLPLFYGLIAFGALRLMAQDGSLFGRSGWSSLGRHLFWQHHMARRTCRHVLDYLRPRFHPWQLDDRNLAQMAIDRHSRPWAPILRPMTAADPD